MKRLSSVDSPGVCSPAGACSRPFSTEAWLGYFDRFRKSACRPWIVRDHLGWRGRDNPARSRPAQVHPAPPRPWSRRPTGRSPRSVSRPRRRSIVGCWPGPDGGLSDAGRWSALPVGPPLAQWLLARGESWSMCTPLPPLACARFPAKAAARTTRSTPRVAATIAALQDEACPVMAEDHTTVLALFLSGGSIWLRPGCAP